MHRFLSAALGAAVVVAAGAACARQGAPPGGPEDRRPPVVVTTRPDTFEVVERDLNTVRFVFDERISERVAGGGLITDAVLVSPLTGEVDVDHNRGGLEITLAGGYQPGRVYRVTLLPVISDLFGNQMRDPFELVFSTGAELVPSAVAGLAWDRTTGEGIEDLRVMARDTRDSTVYLARTDTAGIFAFRYLPPGPYQLIAFQDRDRDGEVDRMEPQGDRGLQVVGADTVVTEIGLLQPDTTSAVLTSVEVLDSLTLLLEFDEPLSPVVEVQPGNAGLNALRTDSAGVARDEEGNVLVDEEAPAPEVDRVFHEHEYRLWSAETRDSLARLDSLDAAAADQAMEAGDTARAQALRVDVPRTPPVMLGGGAPAGGRGGPGGGAPEGPRIARGPDGRPLPSRRLVVRLAEPLEAGQPFQVVTTGITNLAEIPLGGGSAVVVREAPPPPEPQPDSLAAPGEDSLAASDTLGEPLGAVPDTAAPLPDSVAPAGADTLQAAPDTVSPSAVPPATPDTVPPPDSTAVARVPALSSTTSGPPPGRPRSPPR